MNRAFDMGLESAVYVLEKSIGLSRAGQRLMLETLREDLNRGTGQGIFEGTWI